MLEKSSTVILTQDEIQSVEKGILPDRLKEVWGLTLPQAQEIILETKKSSPPEGSQEQ